MIKPIDDSVPNIHTSCFIAPSAEVIGAVTIGDSSSVWYQAILRGDVLPILIGSRTNVQDQCVLHTSPGAIGTTIGNDVTIGHRAILHSVTVKDRVLVGMGAILLDFSIIGEDSIIGAGSLVTKGTIIPPRSLVIGSPAKVIRTVSDLEIAMIRKSAEGYVLNAIRHARI